MMGESRKFGSNALGSLWTMPAQDASTPVSVSFIAGGVAGGVEAIATYPFEFAKTRVQLRNQSGAASSKNPFLVVSQVLRNEGYRALYKGCSTLVVFV
ncbi:MAG: hypothetical protein Q9205_007092 [Flavoplaca limonia]